jgi:hypothetical protein
MKYQYPIGIIINRSLVHGNEPHIDNGDLVLVVEKRNNNDVLVIKMEEDAGSIHVINHYFVFAIHPEKIAGKQVLIYTSNHLNEAFLHVRKLFNFLDIPCHLIPVKNQISGYCKFKCDGLDYSPKEFESKFCWDVPLNNSGITSQEKI